MDTTHKGFTYRSNCWQRKNWIFVMRIYLLRKLSEKWNETRAESLMRSGAKRFFTIPARKKLLKNLGGIDCERIKKRTKASK